MKFVKNEDVMVMKFLTDYVPKENRRHRHTERDRDIGRKLGLERNGE